MYFLIFYYFLIVTFQFYFDIFSVYKERTADVSTGDGWQIVFMFPVVQKNSGNLIGLHVNHVQSDWATFNKSVILLIYTTKTIAAMIVTVKVAGKLDNRSVCF